MSTVYSHSLLLPWSISATDERRFRKILTLILVLTLALGIAIPLLPVVENTQEEQVQLPPRVAKLIFEKRTEPKPPPIPKPVKKPEPEPVKKTVQKKPLPKQKTPPKVVKKPDPQPRINTVEQARKKASSAGLLAMSDALADLRDQSVDDLQGSRRLSNNGSKAAKTQRSLVTSKAGSASKGINTSRLSRDTGSTKLAARTATEVKSSIDAVAPNRNSKTSSRGTSRSHEEIQVVFDRNKSAIYSMYNRALRKDPTLQGKLVLKLTIAPSGQVTGIEVLSSDLGEPTLERKLVQRIKMINFGAKPVDAVTLTYPIDFLPA